MAGTAQDKKKEEAAAQDAPETNNLTFGQNAVGISDTSHGKDIDGVKSCFASLIDKMNDLRQTKYEQDEKGKDNLDKPIQNGEQKMAADMAIQSLIVAYNNAIKALEWTN